MIFGADVFDSSKEASGNAQFGTVVMIRKKIVVSV